MNEPLNSDLERLTEEILGSYDSDARMRRIDEEFLPSRAKIVEILDETRQLLFPGYVGPKKLTGENVRFHVGNLLSKLGWDLAEQINQCMCGQRQCGQCHDRDQCARQAARLAHEFLKRIPPMRRLLMLDAQAAYDGDPAAKSIDEVIYCYPGFFAVTVYRIAHELTKLGVPLMPRIMTEYAHSITGTDIHPGAKIGESFFIDHATGVVIGETSEIGNHVKIYQGVTLGAYSFPKDERGRVIKGLKRHPTIEDNVTIYANATILGGQTVIGAGAEVGGNTWVRNSIEPAATVTSDLPKLKVRPRKTPRR